jgi:hypothetical protein
MTGQVKMFTSRVDDAGDHEQVSFDDNSKGRISRLGEISLTNDLSLSNVLFVDSCSYNLLSIAQFCDLGLSCTFDDEGVTLTSHPFKRGFHHHLDDLEFNFILGRFELRI